MAKRILIVLFLAMMGGRALGLDIGLGPGLSIKNALIYAAAVLIAIDGAVAGNRRIQLLPVFVPFIFLIVFALLSWAFMVVFGDDPNYSARLTLIRLKTKLIDQFIVLLIFFYGVVKHREALALLKGLTWVVIAGCVITVVDSYDIPNLGIITARDTDGRIEGIIGSAAEFGGLLAFYIPPIFALALDSAETKRAAAFVGVAASLISVLLAASRGAMLALVSGAAAAAIYLRDQINARTLLRLAGFSFVLIGIAAFVVLFSQYGSLLQERLMTGLETGSAENVSSGRTAIWTTAIKEMAAEPFSFIAGLGWEAYFQTSGRRLATHNVYLDRLYNLGSIGLILFLAVHLAAIRTLQQSVASLDAGARPYVLAAIIGMISFMVAMLFTDLQSAATYMWAYVGLALRVAVTEPSEQELESRFSGHKPARLLQNKIG